MTRRLFLHVGMMKSGTTYIQGVCDRNAEALERDGLRWLLGSYTTQAAAAAEFRRSARRMPGLEGSWKRLREEVRAHDGDALLSFELLADMQESQVKRFVKALDASEVHVIVTARDLSRVLPSLWQESTQGRGTVRWAEYLAAACDDTVDSELHQRIDEKINVPQVLRTWSSVVPPERLHLITVPRSAADPDELWRRFASVVGVGPGLGRSRRSNPTLGAVSSELMIRLNERVEDVDWPTYRLGFKNSLAKRGLSKRSSDEPRTTLPPERWEWVQARAGAMIEEIKQIGPNIVGDLDDLSPAPLSAGVPADWRPSDSELLEAALDGLEQLGRQLGQARAQLWKVRHGDEDEELEGGRPGMWKRAVRSVRSRVRR